MALSITGRTRYGLLRAMYCVLFKKMFRGVLGGAVLRTPPAFHQNTFLSGSVCRDGSYMAKSVCKTALF